MKKIVFKNSRGLNLVGNLYKSNIKSDSIIILCHGFMSDKYSRGRFEKMSKALNENGYNAFIFDFSGCGESDDAILTIENEVDDLNAAIELIRNMGYKNIGLFGHSLGTLICLKSNISESATMVLTGALTDAMNYNWDEFFTAEQMIDLKEKGFIEEYLNNGIREKIIVDNRILNGFSEIVQSELLENVNGRILIIHGDADEEERLLYKRSEKAMKYISSDSELRIIKGANHSFMEEYNEVINMTIDWFNKHYK